MARRAKKVESAAAAVVKPYVAADRTYIAIVLLVTDSYAYFVSYDRGIRVVRRPRESFLSTYKPLTAAGVPYSIQVAARRYLDWGKRAGITTLAESTLQKLTTGDCDMSDVQDGTKKQEDPKIPTTGALGTALEKAAVEKTPKASTKSGTTAAAKRPSRAKSSTPAVSAAPPPATKENTMASKSKSKSKSAARKSSAPKSAARKSSNGNGATAPTSARGRPHGFDGNKTIKVLAEGNPRREGSKGHENWAILKRYDGKTVEGYLKAGGGSDHLRWDLAHKNVKLI